jgi:TatA/E family protein of Tat protein translocase
MLSPVTAGVALVVALIVFGPKKIPEIANAFGKSINEFKKGMKEVETSFHTGLDTSHPEHRLEPPAAPVQLADAPHTETPSSH